ncbi:MAG: hypothetical protein M4579_003691 [Chaenotheca gracillima]|nr:MAG: hypothetical protein M4579_003691 [Chaenotheca gracillima]
MSAIRPFNAMDLFRFNLTNLDPLTETYDLSFYLNYLAKWPSMFNVVEGTSGEINGYIMGKLESSPRAFSQSEHSLPWHGHITAVTIAPRARRMGFARKLCESLENISDEYNAWFVDLFVRESNKVAIGMYRTMGYSVFRRVVEYYSDDPTTGRSDGEDAFDMRKPLSRDKYRKHIREKGEDIRVSPEDVW